MTCLPVPDESLIINKNVVALHATAKLLMGPTIEVSTSSRTGLRKFLGLTGVGLAQPSIGMPVNAATSGNKIVPTGSICLIGFSVMRPSMRAVGSPRRLAIQA